DRYPEMACLSRLPAGTVLDGEIVVLKGGKSDFVSLMSREQARSPLKVRLLSQSMPATYIVFDLLYDSYHSVMAEPLQARREWLAQLVAECAPSRLRLSEGVFGQGKAFFQEVCRQEMEGVIGKRLGSRYLPGKRTEAWIKVKRGGSVLCAIIGFVPSGKDDFR